MAYPSQPVRLIDEHDLPVGNLSNPLIVTDTAGGGGGGGGGAVTVANGADVAQGSTTDAAVTDPSLAATVIALLKGLLTFLRVSAAGLGKAEDAPHVSGDTGVQVLGVRNDAGTALAADGDYMPPTFDSAGRLRVVTSGGASGGTSAADDSPFTVGADSITPIGALFDDSSPDSVDEGDVGAVRMSGNRAMHVELRDGAGNERGANVNASGQLEVAVGNFPATQPVSAAALPLPTGASTEATLAAASAKLPATLGQKAMAASMAVVVASDQSAVPVSAGSLPLPSGAATEATLAAASAKLPATLGQKAMAASMAVVLASDQSAVPVSGPLTDAQLRAAAVPVSAASLPLPTGAATEATLSAQSAKLPASLGQKAKSASLAVTLASDEDNLALLGAVNETAPATDTASSGLNGRLQRIAQRITSLIALIPAALGQSTMANSFRVVLASDHSDIVVKPSKASSANTPSILTSGGDVLSSNSARKAWSIQNLGTNVLFVRLATGASSTVFHYALKACAVADDGTGGVITDEIYTGVVSATGTSPRFVATEL